MSIRTIYIEYNELPPSSNHIYARTRFGTVLTKQAKKYAEETLKVFFENFVATPENIARLVGQTLSVQRVDPDGFEPSTPTL